MNPVPDPQSDARILETLRAHDERERAVLEAYRRLVDESSDEGIRYLGQLLIGDEERHHQLIAEIANRVESWLQPDSADRGTPSLEPRVDPRLLEATRRLIALERQDAKELRALKRDCQELCVNGVI